ncbi:transposase [Actinomycetospora lutea]|uniref:transposase n=1 Tax=Actinomycetospora lutea TaxID=663604 RepID=UPI003B67D75F
MGRRGYPPEFRRKVLDLVEAGRPVVDVARDLGISAESIYTWRRQDRIDAGLQPGLTVTRGVRAPDRPSTSISSGPRTRNTSSTGITGSAHQPLVGQPSGPRVTRASPSYDCVRTCGEPLPRQAVPRAPVIVEVSTASYATTVVVGAATRVVDQLLGRVRIFELKPGGALRLRSPACLAKRHDLGAVASFRKIAESRGPAADPCPRLFRRRSGVLGALDRRVRGPTNGG